MNPNKIFLNEKIKRVEGYNNPDNKFKDISKNW